jgi:hypothetical protein
MKRREGKRDERGKREGMPGLPAMTSGQHQVTLQVYLVLLPRLYLRILSIPNR